MLNADSNRATTLSSVSYDAHSSASTASSSTLPTTSTSPLHAFSLEICIDSVASARIAERSGADRVELCSALIEGGLTPSYGMIESVKRAISIPVMVLIRPRAGDFAYDEDEMSIMLRDIEQCKSIGVTGVVIGILLPDGSIDVDRCQQLIERARPLQVTFHRAFDMVRDWRQAAKQLQKLNVDRLLTSGLAPNCIEGQSIIKELVREYQFSFSILAGGGLTCENIPSFVAQSGVTEVHASLRGDAKWGLMQFRREGVYMGGEKLNKGLEAEYASKFADEQKIRSVATFAASSNR